MDRKYLETVIKDLGTDGPIFAHNASTEIKALLYLVKRKNCLDLTDEIQKIQLHDALGCALVLLTITVHHPIDVARNLAQQESLFNDWLLTHVQQLHGLDLTRLKFLKKGNLS